MRLIKNSFVIYLFLLLSISSLLAQEECTTAVVLGKATIDGRPLLLKNRDTDSVNNEVVYFSEGVYSVVGVVTAGNTSSIWMGINSVGFAIENSLSSDLEGSSSAENGTFMKHALQNCATVDEFEQLLIETNSSGRETKSNYGVIDATGAAAIFETGNNTYTKFDANDAAVAPSGFIVRTNFAMTGDDTGAGHERYNRALELFTEGMLSSEMSHEYILRNISRDLKNKEIDPYPLPYEGSQDGHSTGYIRTNYSINRYRNRSCVVFHGVLPDEDPLLSTMWVILGEPVCGIAVPIWSFAGLTPSEMNGSITAPMCDANITKKELCYTDPTSTQFIDTYALDDGTGGGILSYSLPTEAWTFSITGLVLNDWRESLPSTDQVKNFENKMTLQAYNYYVSSASPSPIDNPPFIFFNHLSEGVTVDGTLSIQPSAYDDNEISKVEFYIDNVLKATDRVSPYFYSWDTTLYSNESHNIKVIAYDDIEQTDLQEISVYVRSYRLSISAGTGGTTNPSPGIHRYDSGAQVSIKATPNSGYRFTGWSGDASGTTNPITITMDSDKSITANFTKVSSDGGDGGNDSGGGCFIATACYGTPMAEEVKTLCAFRDKYLVKNPTGRNFVNFYYKYSPKVADFIQDKEELKAIVRECLKPLIWIISKEGKFRKGPQISFFSFLVHL